ncbi:MAG: tetratricopeptide repeat protein, partial [Bryobacteraceae bacterium]
MTGIHIFSHKPSFSNFRDGPFIAVFLVLIAFFSCTSLLARWYVRERTVRAEAYFKQGQTLAQHGQDEKAIEEYRNALSISRDNRSYRMAIAQALFKLGRYPEAAIYFRELLRDDPVSAVPNLMLARIDAAQGHTEQAVDAYHRAIFGYWQSDAEANRRQARWDLVNMLSKSHNNDNEVLAELLELAGEPGNDLAAKKKIGRMLLQYGSAAQSADVFRDVLRTAHRDADAYAGFGEAELALGNYRDAQTAFRRALHANP